MATPEDEPILEPLEQNTPILLPLHSTTQADPELSTHAATASDEEDEAIQDYRFLSHLSKDKTKPTSTPLLPRRGEKDFEPHGTLAQSSTLAASQAAMRDALSHERVHGPTGFDLVGLPDGSISDNPSTSAPSHLIGYFDVETSLTLIPKQQGVYFRTMGRAVKGGNSKGILLEPEEALYLCERGTLDLRFGRRVGSEGANVDEELASLEGLPTSVQAAYACCIGSRSLTLERYIVYAGLKRAGYSVFRAKSFNEDDSDTQATNPLPPSDSASNLSLQSWFQSLLQNLFSPKPTPDKPLLGTTFFRDYATIYTRLALIPTHTPSTLAAQRSSPDHPTLQTTFHAYRPSTPIRKSNLPPPEFYITVLDARDTSFPTATQISMLLNSVTADINAAETSQRETVKAKAEVKNDAVAGGPGNSVADIQPLHVPRPPNLYARLKNGRKGRNVLLAVVDCGLVSYVRISEGCFAEEKVWMGNAGGGVGGKKGFAPRGGRGRGRGRGGR